ncbi:hypothetical protein H8959_000873 [Pygathrix nigripes]
MKECYPSCLLTVCLLLISTNWAGLIVKCFAAVKALLYCLPHFSWRLGGRPLLTCRQRAARLIAVPAPSAGAPPLHRDPAPEARGLRRLWVAGSGVWAARHPCPPESRPLGPGRGRGPGREHLPAITCPQTFPQSRCRRGGSTAGSAPCSGPAPPAASSAREGPALSHFPYQQTDPRPPGPLARRKSEGGVEGLASGARRTGATLGTKSGSAGDGGGPGRTFALAPGLPGLEKAAG